MTDGADRSVSEAEHSRCSDGVAEAVKAFDGCFDGVSRETEMLDAFRYNPISLIC